MKFSVGVGVEVEVEEGRERGVGVVEREEERGREEEEEDDEEDDEDEDGTVSVPSVWFSITPTPSTGLTISLISRYSTRYSIFEQLLSPLTVFSYRHNGHLRIFLRKKKGNNVRGVKK